MASSTADAIPTIDHKPHAAFFRQSGWLMIASIAGGLMSLGVHFLSKQVEPAQYGIFGTLLMLTACLPTIPIQMLYAQQTASALAQKRERELSWTIRLGTIIGVSAWLVAALLLVAFQNQIAQRWSISDISVLWITLVTILFSLWNPLFSGVLQGRQDFFWMGWSAILMGITRFAVAALLVLVLHSGASGMMIGALVGMGVAAAIGLWRTRDLWTLPIQKFEMRALVRQTIPLIFCFWAFQFMFTSDTMYAKAFFSGQEVDTYVAAGTLSRALLWLVLPLASVMFPKLVHSRASSQKSNLLGLVLLGTALLAIIGGAALCIVGPFVVKIVFPASYVQPTTALLPWYIGAMVPLTLANVLINDLMASERFKVVPFVVLIAIAYGFGLPYYLNHVQKTPVAVLQVLGVSNLVLLGACALGFFFKGKTSAERVAI